MEKLELTSFQRESIEKIFQAYELGRVDLVRTFIDALHADISLVNAHLLPKEKFELHDQASKYINSEFEKKGVEIVYGFFDRGYCVEYSLVDLDHDYIKNNYVLIGVGPKFLRIPLEIKFPYDQKSSEDGNGRRISSWFYFEGDEEFGFKPGLYYVRYSQSGRTNFSLYLGIDTDIVELLGVEENSIGQSLKFQNALQSVINADIDLGPDRNDDRVIYQEAKSNCLFQQKVSSTY